MYCYVTHVAQNTRLNEEKIRDYVACSINKHICTIQLPPGSIFNNNETNLNFDNTAKVKLRDMLLIGVRAVPPQYLLYPHFFFEGVNKKAASSCYREMNFGMNTFVRILILLDDQVVSFQRTLICYIVL